MKKYFISILLIVGILFVNISGVNAICNQTSPDWPDCLGSSSGSGSSSSSSSSNSCINNCNNSDACKTAPNGQACAQCKAKCQQQANEDKENWEDPTEDFDSDATSNADDATGATQRSTVRMMKLQIILNKLKIYLLLKNIVIMHMKKILKSL